MLYLMLGWLQSLHSARSEVKAQARLTKLFVYALLKPLIIVIRRFYTCLRLEFVVASHVSQDSGREHITFVHVIYHTPVPLVDLVDHAANGTFLVRTRLGRGNSLYAEDGRCVLGFERIWYRKDAHMFSWLGSHLLFGPVSDEPGACTTESATSAEGGPVVDGGIIDV